MYCSQHVPLLELSLIKNEIRISVDCFKSFVIVEGPQKNSEKNIFWCHLVRSKYLNYINLKSKISFRLRMLIERFETIGPKYYKQGVNTLICVLKKFTWAET